MKKKLSLAIFLLIILIANSVFAVTTTMEIVEDNVCTINLNESSTFEKRIIDKNLENHEITMQLKISNNSKKIIPSGELMLVIDNSYSMNDAVSGTTTRKNLVLNSANTLVENLLKANNTTLKIGVVSFSTVSATNTGTIADAQKVSDFTNDVSTLKSKISSIEGVGQYTNLDSGLQLAKQSFSNDDTNKYMIVLTDGLPNIAIGYNDLVTYAGLTNVINKTKETLSSLNGINVITMLTGITNEDASFRTEGENVYTYGQVINAVFGTPANPNKGKFYNISDSKIEETITNTIYRELLPFSKVLTDIKIVDYFPQYIVDNFEMTYVEGIDISNISSKIDTATNSITWNVAKLDAEENAIIQYKLKLKDKFDETIIGKILDTNEKVDITFKDFDGTEQSKTSDVTPKIRLVAPEAPKKDETVAPTPLPKTGTPILIFGLIGLIVITTFFGIKSKKTW